MEGENKNSSNKNSETLASRVRAVRNREGISQELFAERIGVSTKLVQDMEHARRRITLPTAKKTAEEFNGRYQHLVDENDDDWTVTAYEQRQVLNARKKELQEKLEKYSSVIYGDFAIFLEFILESKLGYEYKQLLTGDGDPAFSIKIDGDDVYLSSDTLRRISDEIIDITAFQLGRIISRTHEFEKSAKLIHAWTESD